LSRRHAASLGLAAFPGVAPSPVFAFPFFDGPPEDEEAKAKAAAAAAAEKAERRARYNRIRAERMAAEAKAQSDVYRERMASKGLETFGSTVSVGMGRSDTARDLGINPSLTLDAAAEQQAILRAAEEKAAAKALVAPAPEPEAVSSE